jgi:hypothetical protein
MPVMVVVFALTVMGASLGDVADPGFRSSPLRVLQLALFAAGGLGLVVGLIVAASGQPLWLVPRPLRGISTLDEVVRPERSQRRETDKSIK